MTLFYDKQIRSRCYNMTRYGQYDTQTPLCGSVDEEKRIKIIFEGQNLSLISADFFSHFEDRYMGLLPVTPVDQSHPVTTHFGESHSS